LPKNSLNIEVTQLAKELKGRVSFQEIA
jgi:hypothetical protein